MTLPESVAWPPPEAASGQVYTTTDTGCPPPLDSKQVSKHNRVAELSQDIAERMANKNGSINCTELWQSIILSIATSTFYLLALIVIYGKLSRKLEKHSCEHKARRQHGLKAKDPNSALAGKLLESKEMPTHQQELVSHWLSELIQVQQTQGPNVQINSRIPGSSLESSQRSCTRENSGSDDVNYTTLIFKPPVHDTSTGGDHEDSNVKEHYENVAPYSRPVTSGSKDTTKNL